VQEMGPHPELLAQDGVYADMWQRQVRDTTVAASVQHAPHSSLQLAFPFPCYHHVLQAATMPASRSMLSTPSSATSLVE